MFFQITQYLILTLPVCIRYHPLYHLSQVHIPLGLFLFVQKILKPNAFRHTISEGILNLLEGSDAIYGVIVTRHAADRMRERGGLNRKSIQRIANQVYFNGYPIERTKGRLRKWMYKISKSNPSAQNLRIYGDKLYIFSNDVLITVFKIASGNSR